MASTLAPSFRPSLALGAKGHQFEPGSRQGLAAVGDWEAAVVLDGDHAGVAEATQPQPRTCTCAGRRPHGRHARVLAPVQVLRHPQNGPWSVCSGWRRATITACTRCCTRPRSTACGTLWIKTRLHTATRCCRACDAVLRMARDF